MANNSSVKNIYITLILRLLLKYSESRYKQLRIHYCTSGIKMYCIGDWSLKQSREKTYLKKGTKFPDIVELIDTLQTFGFKLNMQQTDGSGVLLGYCDIGYGGRGTCGVIQDLDE